jgi:hypothetical protein
MVVPCSVCFCLIFVNCVFLLCLCILVVMCRYVYFYVCTVPRILFHCALLCIVCVQVCFVILPPGVNPIAVNEIYHIIYHIRSHHIISYHIIYHTIYQIKFMGQFRWLRGLRRESGASSLLGLRFRIPPGKGFPSLEIVVHFQVEVSATG